MAIPSSLSCLSNGLEILHPNKREQVKCSVPGYHIVEKEDNAGTDRVLLNPDAKLLDWE